MWVSFSLISLSDSGPWQTATWAKLGCCLIGFRHSFIIGMFRLELVAVYIESAEWYLGIRLIWYDHQREVSPASASHQPQPWHYVLFIWTFYYATNKRINRFSSTVELVRVHDRYLNINILYLYKHISTQCILLLFHCNIYASETIFQLYVFYASIFCLAGSHILINWYFK